MALITTIEDSENVWTVHESAHEISEMLLNGGSLETHFLELNVDRGPVYIRASHIVAYQD